MKSINMNPELFRALMAIGAQVWEERQAEKSGRQLRLVG